MPKILQYTQIDVTPERFLDACDSTELHELELLLSKPKYQKKMGRRGWRPANWYAVEANSIQPENSGLLRPTKFEECYKTGKECKHNCLGQCRESC